MARRFVFDPINAGFLRHDRWTREHKCAAWACHLSALGAALLAKLIFNV